MTPRDDVIISFRNLAEGQVATSQVCPLCKGGRSQERSLSVGVSGGWLWWRCHRASCPFSGKNRLDGREGTASTHDEHRGRYREFQRQRIPKALKQTLAERFGVEEETFDRAGWSYTPDYDGLGPRVIFPLFSPAGRVRGEQFRSYSDPPHAKKALINGQLHENQISWYRWKKYGKMVVVVEDIPSAVRLAYNGVDALALCGTTLNLERVIEIREQEYKDIILCLDNDAFGQAMKYMQQYSRFLPQMRIKLISDDIKDMTQEHLDLFLMELTS